MREVRNEERMHLHFCQNSRACPKDSIFFHAENRVGKRVGNIFATPDLYTQNLPFFFLLSSVYHLRYSLIWNGIFDPSTNQYGQFQVK